MNESYFWQDIRYGNNIRIGVYVNAFCLSMPCPCPSYRIWQQNIIFILIQHLFRLYSQYILIFICKISYRLSISFLSDEVWRWFVFSSYKFVFTKPSMSDISSISFLYIYRKSLDFLYFLFYFYFWFFVIIAFGLFFSFCQNITFWVLLKI